jgi:ABC-2 type transport system ATP-binding protein
MLCLREISYCYGQNRALKSFSLHCQKPGLIGFFGHNGSGKTTLFNVLSATKSCQKGEIHIFGEPALDKNRFIAKRFRCILGILMQGTSSDAQLSALANLAFYAELMGISKEHQSSSIAATLALSRLEDKALEPLKSYSHGMRRRLELYRTFMHKPKILLLDEPTAGLDVEEIERFFDFAREYQEREQALILFSTHHAAELERCDRVVMIKDGALIAEESTDKLIENLDYWRYEVALDHAGIPKALSFRRADLAEHYQKLCEANHV